MFIAGAFILSLRRSLLGCEKLGFNSADEFRSGSEKAERHARRKKVLKECGCLNDFNLGKILRATVHIAIPTQIPCRTLR